MGSDFYTEDYSYGGGGYYDGGGGFDYGGELYVEPGYFGGGSFDLPDNPIPGGEAIAWGDIGVGDDFNYGYGFDTGLPPDYGPSVEPSSGDLFYDFFAYYTDLGYDLNTAAELAMQDASAGSISIPTYEQAAPPTLPEISYPASFPYMPSYKPWQSPPYIPVFTDLPTPQAPPLPSSPASSQPNLPPACPGGQYHPYPIGDPRQNQCVPFPTQSTPQQQQKPSGQQSGSSAGASKPQQQQPGPTQPQQQACPPNSQRNPQTGQCVAIPPRCTTPGTVYDQARGQCVPQGQAISPLPEETEDLLSNLKNLPWWVWIALGGLFLLNKDGDSGRKTTVTYRRAR